MNKSLCIGKALSLPIDAVTQTFAIVAKRGSGKTYTAAVLTEELIGSGQPVVVLDPIGVWWGLRASASGKQRGLPVVIFGGERGDVPLEPSAGRVIADWVVSDRRPCVLDLSLFRKAEQRRFVQDLAEELYRRNRDPLHVVLDEADAFAPQRPMPGEQAMLGAIEDLVRRGRARGLGCTLITQRPAVLHKDVLTQAEVLVALRMLSPQDRGAVDAWIKFHGTEEERREVLSSLSSLPIGTAWFWAPGWLGILKRVTVRTRRTFDSSSTPKAGKRRVVPKALAPVELETLRGRIADTIERAKADDPRQLRKRIAELERQLAKRPEPERVEVPAVSDDMAERLELAVSEFRAVALDAAEKLKPAYEALNRAFALPPHMPAKPNGKPPTVSAQPVPRAPRPAHGGAGAGDGTIGGGLRRIMVALAQRPQGLTQRQLGVRAQLSSRSGTFATYLSRGRSSGWIDGRGTLRITDEGLAALGSYEPLPTGQALLDHWLGQLGQSGAARILAALAEAYPTALSQDEAAERAGLSARSGTFATYLSKLRTLELIDGRGELRASEELFQ